MLIVFLSLKTTFKVCVNALTKCKASICISLRWICLKVALCLYVIPFNVFALHIVRPSHNSILLIILLLLSNSRLLGLLKLYVSGVNPDERTFFGGSYTCVQRITV